VSDEQRQKRNLCVHGLRHTFVSHLRASGIPDFIVASLSGHSDLEMVRRYSHTTGLINYDTLREVIAKAPGVTLEKDYQQELN
jgi:integrase